MRYRFETELAMRQSVESDIAGLKTLKREYSSTNAILLQEVTGLEKERAALKDAHHQVNTPSTLNSEEHKITSQLIYKYLFR